MFASVATRAKDAPCLVGVVSEQCGPGLGGCPWTVSQPDALEEGGRANHNADRLRELEVELQDKTAAEAALAATVMSLKAELHHAQAQIRQLEQGLAKRVEQTVSEAVAASAVEG